jgi:DNA-directed RNA polymerase subunit beta
MDVSPKQIVGVSAALIPFLEHDDANRALMGSNMQRQAVPLVKPDAPVVGTGMEYQAAVDSGQVVWPKTTAKSSARRRSDGGRARADGTRGSTPCASTTAPTRAPASTSAPVVFKGDVVKVGDVLADSSSTENGELALGQNVWSPT